MPVHMKIGRIDIHHQSDAPRMTQSAIMARARSSAGLNRELNRNLIIEPPRLHNQ
jgi:hypothetical protein